MQFSIHGDMVGLVRSDRKRSLSNKLNYIVVDSDNQEEVGSQIKWNIHNHYNNNHKNQLKQTIGDSICRDIDNEILQAKQKVQSLQKQCMLLEQIITTIIKEQSELIVEDRRRQRSKSLRKQNKSEPKPCPIHTKRKISILQQEIDQIIEFKLSRQSIDNNQFNTTLPFCRRQQNNGQQIIESKKTAQIRYKAKGRQNIAPPKKYSKQRKKGTSIKEKRL